MIIRRFILLLFFDILLCIYRYSYMKFLNRKSPRAQWHDYGSVCCYFITICCKDREHYFGEIEDWCMMLNVLGRYCDECIWSISRRRKTIDIHEYIVMPNHIHILIMMSEFTPKMNIAITNTRRDGFLGHPNNKKSWFYDLKGHAKSKSLQTFNENYTWPTLWSVINMLKWVVTKYAKKQDIVFERQWRYHDSIVRDQHMYENIRQYIIHNPENWKEDRYWK